MSDLVLQVQNPAHWQLLYSQNHQALPDLSFARTGYRPIPPFELPFLLTSRILAIAAASEDVPPNWWLGCRVRGVMDAPIGVNRVTTAQTRIPLNRGAFILPMPQWSAQYRLEVEIPYWHQSLDVTVWEYSGPVALADQQALQEQGELIRIDLARIEQRIRWLQP